MKGNKRSNINSSSISIKKKISITGENIKIGRKKIIESETVETQSSGAKIIKKRTIKTLAPRGHEKTTPWGVTLKPVPRKSISEEIIKTDSEKIEVSKYDMSKGSSPQKSKLIKSQSVKPDPTNDLNITETVQIKVSHKSFQHFPKPELDILINLFFHRQLKRNQQNKGYVSY